MRMFLSLVVVLLSSNAFAGIAHFNVNKLCRGEFNTSGRETGRHFLLTIGRELKSLAFMIRYRIKLVDSKAVSSHSVELIARATEIEEKLAKFLPDKFKSEDEFTHYIIALRLFLFDIVQDVHRSMEQLKTTAAGSELTRREEAASDLFTARHVWDHTLQNYGTVTDADESSYDPIVEGLTSVALDALAPNADQGINRETLNERFNEIQEHVERFLADTKRVPPQH